MLRAAQQHKAIHLATRHPLECATNGMVNLTGRPTRGRVLNEIHHVAPSKLLARSLDMGRSDALKFHRG
jgi:hypothetical protein